MHREPGISDEKTDPSVFPPTEFIPNPGKPGENPIIQHITIPRYIKTHSTVISNPFLYLKIEQFIVFGRGKVFRFGQI